MNTHTYTHTHEHHNTDTGGPYLPESGVQRGSVLYLPLCPGNPRGRSAQCGYTESELLPNIPVMPLSAQDAQPILAGMTGQSIADWTGSVLGGAAYPIGPGPSTVNMSVINDRREEEIQNVILTIPGKCVLHITHHYDSSRVLHIKIDWLPRSNFFLFF